MNIAVIGAGYVGLTSAAIFADLGNTVWAVRKDEDKIEMLKKGEIPFYEPGLAEIVKRNVEAGRLIPTVDYSLAVPPAEVVLICVGTPSLPTGEADLSQVFAAAKEIAQNLNDYKVIVDKSTVPIGTAEQVRKIINDEILKKTGSLALARDDASRHFEMASCPEFLRQGSAVYDTFNPDRVVIGVDSSWRAREILLALHKPLPGERVFCDIKTAEMIKYASNAFLATSISFINSLSRLCEKTGADVTQVAKAMRLDRRIGKNAFLDAGCGYGGSCFPKDVKALVNICQKADVSNELLEAVEKINFEQKELMAEKIWSIIKDKSDAVVGLWGLAFKPKTDDLRDAPSRHLISYLLNKGVRIKAYDPVAQERAKELFPNIHYATDCFEAARGVDCLAIVTEWDEFRELDKIKLKSVMKNPNIVDGRNIYEPEEMKKIGFNYLSIGRK